MKPLISKFKSLFKEIKKFFSLFFSKRKKSLTREIKNKKTVKKRKTRKRKP